MKSKFYLLFCAVACMFLLQGIPDKKTANKSYLIQKENGKIILAYKAFGDFLDTDKRWDTYQSMLLDAYPSITKVHRRQAQWGDLDTIKFPTEVGKFKKEDFEQFLNRYDLTTINYLYDDIIGKAHQVLPPASKKAVDLCFFLPYGGGCFVIPEDTLNTIFISMYIDPKEAEKIMAHEYAHILHIDRRPQEPLTLKREVISEGMAVYLTNRIIKNMEPSNSIPFMPKSSFEWCMKNEQIIRDSIRAELNDTGDQIFKRYISDGSWAKPPVGFVEKTAYFIGYRIIEKCFDQGMSIEEICALPSEMVIRRSGYFK